MFNDSLGACEFSTIVDKWIWIVYIAPNIDIKPFTHYTILVRRRIYKFIFIVFYLFIQIYE